MFQQANIRASKFTFPVVISLKTVDGKCSGSIGSFIVVNDEGWIATCDHIATEIGNAVQNEEKALALAAQKQAINADVAPRPS